MAVHTYETLFLLEPNRASSDPEGSLTQLTNIIQGQGCEILFCRPWGEPKLAYPIGKFKKGFYVLCYYKGEAKAQAIIEKEFKLVEFLVRHMTTKLHPIIAGHHLAHLNNPNPQPADEPVAAPAY